MLTYDRKHLIWLGLAQVGVVVEGYLGCGMHGGTGFPHFFFSYGAFFLLVPPVWTLVAIAFCEAETATPLREILAYLSGAMMVLLPGCYFFWMIVVPFLPHGGDI